MRCGFVVLAALLLAGQARAQQPQEGLREWLGAIDTSLGSVLTAARSGDVAGARARSLRAYLDHYETVEGWYGAGGRYTASGLDDAVAAAERSFHTLIASNSAGEMERTATELRGQIAAVQRAALSAGVSLYPDPAELGEASSGGRSAGPLQTEEMRAIGALLERAEAAFREGRNGDALRLVEEAYLEGFEPLESRLPGEIVGGIERTIHLQLRPALRGSGSVSSIQATFAALRVQLGAADAFLAQGGSFWFGVFHAFIIIVREGLEAVLLIAALLAYLGASGAAARDRRRIWAGAAAGIVASLLTWVVAVTLVPMGGASRELVEGITALVAVGVLLYVSHWLFQKTYIHDWKAYLREHLGSALTRGSAAAMMGLAFAAVYREGFETVLFYQALLFDSGGKAVLAGFFPGLLVIAAVGFAIIRAGMKLPLRRVFAVTNTILLCLAFVFLGKGIYNLQESGAFSAHPVGWLPSHPALEQVFGFYPLLETMLAQLALAGLLGLALIVYRRRLLRVQQQPLNAQPLAS